MGLTKTLSSLGESRDSRISLESSVIPVLLKPIIIRAWTKVSPSCPAGAPSHLILALSGLKTMVGASSTSNSRAVSLSTLISLDLTLELSSLTVWMLWRAASV